MTKGTMLTREIKTQMNYITGYYLKKFFLRVLVFVFTFSQVTSIVVAENQVSPIIPVIEELSDEPKEQPAMPATQTVAEETLDAATESTKEETSENKIEEPETVGQETEQTSEGIPENIFTQANSGLSLVGSILSGLTMESLTDSANPLDPTMVVITE